MSSIEITQIQGKPPVIHIIKVEEDKLEEILEFLECDFYSVEKHPRYGSRYVAFYNYENPRNPFIRTGPHEYILVYPEVINGNLEWERSRVWTISEETLELFKRQQRVNDTVDIKALS